MSKGDTSAVITADPITPKFFNTTPLLDQVLPPLTPKQEEEVGRLMTETPEYQSIMKDCVELKEQTLKAAAQAIAHIQLIKAGTITKDDPELWEASMELITAAAETARAGKAALAEINTNLKEADLPLGECAMKDDAPEQPAPEPGLSVP